MPDDRDSKHGVCGGGAGGRGAGGGGGGGSELCLRVLCDMRCLVAITFVFLAGFLSIIVVGLTTEGATNAAAASVPPPAVSLVAVDTDMGTDDAMALMILLEAEKKHYNHSTNVGPKVVAITCVIGNTAVDNVVINVLKILNLSGRLDGSIPVYRGASKSMKQTPAIDDYFGADGMGDVPGVPTPPQHYVSSTHAAVALVELVNTHPGEITLLALGPLTNIALAIRLDEDFLTKLKHLVILGGSTEGRGNKIPGAEFNFYMDAEANYVVLKDAKYNDGTVSLLSWEEIENMKVTYTWRAETLGALQFPRIQFLNEAEGINKDGFPSSWAARGTWDMADAVAATVLLYPDMAERREDLPIVVFTQGEARGGIAVDYYRSLRDARNLTLVGDVNVDKYKRLLLDYFNT